jgi:hypothetical protein
VRRIDVDGQRPGTLNGGWHARADGDEWMVEVGIEESSCEDESEDACSEACK